MAGDRGQGARPGAADRRRGLRRRLTARRLAAAATVAVVAMLVWLAIRGAGRRDDTVPERIRMEKVVANLSARFERDAVTREPREGAVRIGRLQPTRQLHSGHRTAIVMPPPSRVQFTTRAPAGAMLRFGIGVESDGRRDPDAAGIRFAVRVDGREAFTRTVNPGASRHDRRWFDARVDLGIARTRDTVIELSTERVGTDGSTAGRAGWSDLRIVREEARDRQPAGQDSPSVLLLLVDTLRADVLGCYGAAPSPSPTLDALAGRGLVFDLAISQSSWTMPAVASLFTGLLPPSHGVIGGPGRDGGSEAAGADGGTAYLADTVLTLAEHAQAGGITTFGITGNSLVSRETNLARGFERFLDLGAGNDRKGWARAQQINDAFVDWLEENADQRFFTYLHYMDVHDPYRPPTDLQPPPPEGARPRVRRGEAATMYRKISAGAVPRLSGTELEYLRALYAAQVVYWDRELHALLEALERLQVRDSTIVIVMSDHGEEFLEHGHLGHSKTLYDELLHVPLVLVGPGVPAHRVTTQVQLTDMFPTIASLLDLPRPDGLPGNDLLAASSSRPALSDTVRGVAPDGTMTHIVSLRTAAWKLIHMPAFDLFQLYDLTADPDERENRFGQVPEGERLARILAEAQHAMPPAPAGAGHDPRFVEKLQALGYVE